MRINWEKIKNLNVSCFVESESSIGRNVQFVEFEEHRAFSENRQKTQNGSVQRITCISLFILKSILQNVEKEIIKLRAA